MATKLYVAALAAVAAMPAILYALPAFAVWAGLCAIAGLMILWRLSLATAGVAQTGTAWQPVREVGRHFPGRHGPAHEDRYRAPRDRCIARQPSVTPQPRGRPVENLIAGTVTELRAVIRGDKPPTSELAARAAILVATDPTLQNSVLRLGLGHEHTAALAWTHIAATLRGAARADALTFAAVNYYLANELTCVVVALDEADAAAGNSDLRTTPALARMLAQSLVLHMPPDQIRVAIPSCPA